MGKLKIPEYVLSSAGDVADMAGDYALRARNGVIDLPQRVREGVADLPERVVTAYRELPQKAKEIYRNMEGEQRLWKIGINAVIISWMIPSPIPLTGTPFGLLYGYRQVSRKYFGRRNNSGLEKSESDSSPVEDLGFGNRKNNL